LAAPWQLFTSLHMHAISKLALWPLGTFTEDRTHLGKALSHAWDVFVTRGLAGNVWVRVESTAASLLPIDVASPGPGNGMPNFTDVKIFWPRAHGFSIWGMLGLVLFPAAVLHLAQNWRRERLMLAGLIAPFLVLVVLGAGLPDTWGIQSALALVALLSIWGAEMLLRASRAARWFVWSAIAFELLTTAYVSEYDPYNASGASIALFAVLGIGAHLLLLGGLARTIGLRPPTVTARLGRREQVAGSR
jgi:hypothetical protein